MKKVVKSLFIVGLFFVMAANVSVAQTHDHLVGVTYRTADLQICNGDLGDFYKQYANEQFASDVFFENLHVLKVKNKKKNFYLLAKEQNSSRVYAFPLIRRGNGLYLNTKEHVHVSTKGEQVLTALLQNENAILGCTDCITTVVASAR